jgi:hypothetical protein
MTRTRTLGSRARMILLQVGPDRVVHFVDRDLARLLSSECSSVNILRGELPRPANLRSHSMVDL